MEIINNCLKIQVGDSVILLKEPRTNITEEEVKKGLVVGAIGKVVEDMPSISSPLRYVIQFDIGIRKGWFAANEISLINLCRATRNMRAKERLNYE